MTLTVIFRIEKFIVQSNARGAMLKEKIAKYRTITFLMGGFLALAGVLIAAVKKSEAIQSHFSGYEFAFLCIIFSSIFWLGAWLLKKIGEDISSEQSKLEEEVSHLKKASSEQSAQNEEYLLCSAKKDAYTAGLKEEIVSLESKLQELNNDSLLQMLREKEGRISKLESEFKTFFDIISDYGALVAIVEKRRENWDTAQIAEWLRSKGVSVRQTGILLHPNGLYVGNEAIDSFVRRLIKNQ